VCKSESGIAIPGNNETHLSVVASSPPVHYLSDSEQLPVHCYIYLLFVVIADPSIKFESIDRFYVPCVSLARQ